MLKLSSREYLNFSITTKLLLDMLTGYVKRFRSLIESAWLLFKLGNRFARSSYLLGMSSSNIAGVILTTPMG
jgi:hypothetical protein